jgi:hypothetical protein
MIVLHRLQRSLLFHPWIKRVLTTISSAIILCIFIKDLYDYAQRFNGPSPLLITDDGAHHQFDFETEMGLNGDTNNLPKPPTNKNWAQRDISSTIRLGYGSPIGPKRTGIHSTFRGSWDMNGYEVSCQLWRQSKL